MRRRLSAGQHRPGWSPEQVLQASDDDANLFGGALALDGNTLIVGARGATTGGFLGAGAAYVFVRNGATWTQQAKLVASDPEQTAEFGYAVALDGDTCAIGAPQSTSNFTLYAGATYVFVRSGANWMLQQRIVPIAPFSYVYGSRSGRALGLSGNSLLIGAPTSFDLASNTLFAGRVFEWTRVGAAWSQSAELTPNDSPDGRQFGTSIGYDGVRAAFGAWSENNLPTGANVGTAYVFRRAGGWVQEGELPRPGIDNTDNFGTSVDLDGPRVIAGAPAASVPGNSGGEAYVWRIDAPTLAYCTAKTNSLGCAPGVSWSGTASASSLAPFTVSASQVLNQKLGLAFYGFAPAAAPFQGGFLCIEPPTTRRPTSNSGGAPSGSSCTGVFQYEFNAWIQSGADPALVAGADLYVQFWYRDPASPSTTGLSNALRTQVQP